MIFVEDHSKGFFQVKFIPTKRNREDIRQVPGARYGNKAWIVPLWSLEDFEDVFRGRFIFVTPRHHLTGDPAPAQPKMYQKIPKKPVKIKGNLYGYQKFGANFLACIAERTGHAFLTDAVGTGKTVQSIAAANIMQDDGLVDSVFVFCKASLKYQWQRDGIKKFTDDDCIVIDGTKKQRTKQFDEAKDPGIRFVIMNYEMLLNDYDDIMNLALVKGVKLIIADEAHKITNHTGKMNAAMKKLVQPKGKYPGIPYIFYLTATPMASKVDQLFGIFGIRRPDHFGKHSDFAKDYLEYEYKGRQAKLVGIQNYEQLRNKVNPYMLRRTDEEIDMELPKMVEIMRKIDMTPLQKDLDDRAKEELLSVEQKVANAYKNRLPEATIEAIEGAVKAMIYTRKAIANTPELIYRSKSQMIKDKFGPMIDSADAKWQNKSPKLDELMDLVDELVIQNNQKMIVFTELETMVRIIQDRLDKIGVGNTTFTGKVTSNKERDARIQKFESDPDCYVLIATEAAAEGLNLQFSQYLVNFDLPWNPDKWTQRKGRIQRGGSKYKSVKVFNFVSTDSIDEAVVKALEDKQNVFNFFVGNTEQQSEAIKEAME